MEARFNKLQNRIPLECMYLGEYTKRQPQPGDFVHKATTRLAPTFQKGIE
jgi:hypothetical protein